ncbi:MAG TPA: tripartite tricarboxylate transporter substrate binding protein [Burkholderiales bacterium]
MKRRILIKRILFSFCAAAAALFILGVHAQDWPTKPLTFIVPFPPGGAADMFGRVIAEHLAQRLGQPVVVKNVAGAGGNIAMQEAARAAPDGYTLFQGTIGTHAINPALYTNLQVDPTRDFAPVAHIGGVPNVLVVNPSLSVRSVQELTEYARANPGKLNMGSSGSGSSIHLSGELYKHLAKVDIVHVPYRGGAAALTDLIGGQIDLMFDNLPVSLPHIQKGALRALAVTSRTRSPLLPDVPTMIEAGVPGYEATAWSGIFVPAGTPDPIVRRLNREIRAILESEAVRQRFSKLGAVVETMTPEEFGRFVAAEREKWTAMVRVSGAKVD